MKSLLADFLHNVMPLGAFKQGFTVLGVFRETQAYLENDSDPTVFGLPFTASQYCFGKVFPV